MVALLDDESNNSHTSIKQMRGYPVLLCRIPLNSLGQLSIRQVQMRVMRVKNQEFRPWPRRRRSGYRHMDAQLQQTRRGAKCHHAYRALFLYILYAAPNYDQHEDSYIKQH